VAVQVDGELAVRVPVRHAVRQSDGQRCLADPRHAVDGHDRAVGRGGEQVRQLSFAAGEVADVPGKALRRRAFDRAPFGRDAPGRGWVGRGGFDRVTAQDRLVQPPEPPARVQPELIGEQRPRLGEDRQRLGRTPGPVEGQHVQFDQAFPGGVGRGQPGQVRDEILTSTHGDADGHRLFGRVQPQLVQVGEELVAQAVVGHVGQRRSAPQGQRLTQQACALR
jgi:hypothetical protein